MMWAVYKSVPPVVARTAPILVASSLPVFYLRTSFRTGIASIPSEAQCDNFALSVQEKTRRFSTKDNSVQVAPRKRWFYGLLESLKDFLRVLEIGLVFIPLGILYVPCYVYGQRLEEKWRVCMVWTLQYFGPTFIKFGQWASTRADLFSVELRVAFARNLASKNAHQPFPAVEKTICKAFGIKEVGEVFDQLEPVPVGAGCVAQVHRGVLREGGQRVAVKIISGSVLEVLQRDIRILTRVASTLQYFLPEEFGLRNIVRQFMELMTKQVDLRVEAANLGQLAVNFEKIKEVDIPEVVAVSSDGNVLIETYQEGVLLSELLASDATTSGDNPLQSYQLRKQIADVGLKSFLQMVLVDNFVHTDLHPGNIIVRLTSNGTQLEGISIIDAGLITTLSSSNKENFIDLFVAVAHGNGEEAGRLMITRSGSRERKGEEFTDNERRFIAGMKEVVSQHGSFNFSLDKVKFGEVLQSVLGLVYTCRVPIDTNFSNLVLSFVVAEGILRQLDPGLNIFNVALPILYKMDPAYKARAKAVLYDTII